MTQNRVSEMRRAYALGGLNESDLAPDPLEQFAQWFDDAVRAGIREPNAMVLATAAADAVPSARFVLLKGYDERGFAFYTNTESRKGGELAANPRAALLFPWHDLERQVRIEGPVERVSDEEARGYFASRPRGSRLGAWASPQSAVLGSRADLEERLAAVRVRFGGGVDDAAGAAAGDEAGDGTSTAGSDVPLPDFWGGFRVVPEAVEFWQGRADRLHDRLRFRRTPGGWVVERLAP